MARLPNLLDTPSAFSFALSCDDDDYDKENNHNNENEVSHGTGSRDTLDKMEKLVSTTGTGGSAQTTTLLQGRKRKALEGLSQGHTTVQNKPAKRQKTQQEEEKKEKQEPFIKKRDSNIAAPTGRLATASPPPQLDSLQDTIRRHPRARLFVPPGLWTGLHLDLIGTTFVDAVLQDHQDINNTPPEQHHHRRPDATAGQRSSLGSLRLYRNTAHVVALHLSQMLRPWGFSWCQRTASDLKLPFRFGHYTCWLPVQGLIHHPTVAPLPPPPRQPSPSIAIVNLCEVVGSATRLSSTHNSSQSRAHRRRSRREPYVLAVLIALAAASAATTAEQQESEAIALEGRPPIQVYAIDISRDNKTPGVFIYAADISPAFLARFELLAACAAPAAGPLEIRRTWLPYELKLNPFLDRLHAALVPPAV